MKTQTQRIRSSRWLENRVAMLFNPNGISKATLIWIIYILVKKISKSYAEKVYLELKEKING